MGRRLLRMTLLLGLACTEVDPEPVPTETDTETDASDPPEDPAHNILVVVMDDVGPDHVSAYGLDPNAPPTPHLDALAGRGIRFDRAYAQPSCSPTRASILTGRHPHQTLLGGPITVNDPYDLDLSWMTIPRLLDAAPASWSHAAIGKWHLAARDGGGITHPNDAGFAHFDGVLLNLGNRLPGGASESYFRWMQTTNGVSEVAQGYLTTRQTNDAIEQVQTLAEPWFVYLAYSAAHVPFQLPPPELVIDPDIDETSLAHIRFDAVVQAMDAAIGRLVDAIPDDQRAHTTIIVLGDNGTAGLAYPSTDPRHRASKFTVAETGVRVPFIVAGPDVAEPGRVSSALVSSADIFATVAEIAEVEPPADIDGISFVDHLRGGGPHREFVSAERFTPSGPGPYDSGARMVRDARFKLVRTEVREKLFDLQGHEYEIDTIDLLADGEPTDPLALDALARLRPQLDRMP